MHLKFRNVNDAFTSLVKAFDTGRLDSSFCVPKSGDGNPVLSLRRSPSRAGDVLVIDEPVTITYTHPLERVLFNEARDANPFFHLFESLWMLAGSNDLAPLTYYLPKYAEFSDDGKTVNGAYGYRWRVGTYDDDRCVDQLDLIVEHFKNKPDSRRVVLQMWNIHDDLDKIDSSKDVCCNTNVYFLLRPLGQYIDNGVSMALALDMTVCNRSNDLVWGSLGANAVHFSYLQEYLANCLGVCIGVYNQFSNNLHVYTERFTPNKWLMANCQDPYSMGLTPVFGPMVHNKANFDRNVQHFVRHHSTNQDTVKLWNEPYLDLVAEPLCQAFHAHKRKDHERKQEEARRIAAADWRFAVKRWFARRAD